MKKWTIPSLYLSIILLPIALFCFSACANNTKKSISKSGFVFDTFITITLYSTSNEAILEECFQRCKEYEIQFSKTIPTSEISIINQANGIPVTVSDDTITLLQESIRLSKLSNGGFDVTIGQLSNLWDFKNNNTQIPGREAIDTALSTIGYQNIILDENQVSLVNPETQLDFGAIAKGFVADQLKLYLEESDVTSGLINLGGNVLAIGKNADNTPFSIGIQYPFDATQEPIVGIAVTDQSVVTSGIYERYFEVEGTLYHHLLDPQTGYPYDKQLLSVTIISDSSMAGDGLSTACFSLGLKEGLALIESQKNIEAIFITSDYKLHYTSGIGKSIPLIEND